MEVFGGFDPHKWAALSTTVPNVTSFQETRHRRIDR